MDNILKSSIAQSSTSCSYYWYSNGFCMTFFRQILPQSHERFCHILHGYILSFTRFTNVRNCQEVIMLAVMSNLSYCSYLVPLCIRPFSISQNFKTIWETFIKRLLNFSI